MKTIKPLTCILFLATLYSHGISDSDKFEIIHGSLLDFVFLGAKHMITGYDHILFLIGVIFFLTKMSDIVKFVTVFTIGHSITLIFATFYKITANYYLIDSVIAFSVIYKGFENLDGFKKIGFKGAPNLILIVFVFGLIHGFGLSTRLQQLHLDEYNLLQSILSFNIGVEFGQVAVLAIVYPLLSLLRSDSLLQKISVIINATLIVLGVFLFIYQLNGFFNSQTYKFQEKVEIEAHKEDVHTHSHGDEKTKHKH